LAASRQVQDIPGDQALVGQAKDIPSVEGGLLVP
jgi:hypothetical protein